MFNTMRGLIRYQHRVATERKEQALQRGIEEKLCSVGRIHPGEVIAEVQTQFGPEQYRMPDYTKKKDDL